MFCWIYCEAVVDSRSTAGFEFLFGIAVLDGAFFKRVFLVLEACLRTVN